jgi:hypothetical protein
MRALDHLADAGLERGGDVLAGDLAVKAQLIKQLAGGLAVTAAVQVAGAVLEQDPGQPKHGPWRIEASGPGAFRQAVRAGRRRPVSYAQVDALFMPADGVSAR